MQKQGRQAGYRKLGAIREENRTAESGRISERLYRGFWLATVLLIMVSVLSFTGTVMSRTDFDAAEMEGYYREQEKNLERQVREYFEEKVLKTAELC